jgi:hypothetical protein
VVAAGLAGVKWSQSIEAIFIPKRFIAREALSSVRYSRVGAGYPISRHSSQLPGFRPMNYRADQLAVDAS